MITFGMRLKELRESKRVSQAEFCVNFNSFSNDVKITRQSLSNWECSNRFPDEKTIAALAEYFNVSRGYIMGDNISYNKTDIDNYNYFSEMLDKMIKRGDISKDHISDDDWKMLAQVLQADLRKCEEGKK